MTPVRTLALWLAAAIVMIAASLMPSVASAHDGHRHAVSPVAVVSLDSAGATHAMTAGALSAEAKLLCSGPCCMPSGHVCSSCCATGLMPAAELTWAAPMLGSRRLARDVPRRPGIVPEALPEPPRPIA